MVVSFSLNFLRYMPPFLLYLQKIHLSMPCHMSFALLWEKGKKVAQNVVSVCEAGLDNRYS